MVAELSFFYTALVSASTLVNSKGGGDKPENNRNKGETQYHLKVLKKCYFKINHN